VQNLSISSPSAQFTKFSSSYMSQGRVGATSIGSPINVGINFGMLGGEQSLNLSALYPSSPMNNMKQMQT